MPDYLRKGILIDICKDGTITFRRKEEPPKEPAALPVYSVDTEEQARYLQISFCRLTYGGRYVFKNFKKMLEDMDRVAEVFAAAEAKEAGGQD